MIRKENLVTDGNIETSIKTGAAVEPITTAELKTFARIDGTAEDTLIDGFIKAARIQTEKYLNRKLINQTITASLDFWPEKRIRLPFPPLQSVTEIRTLDEEGVETVYSSDNYIVRTKVYMGEIIIKDGGSFPLSTDRDIGAIEIDYVAGYGAAATAIPQTILDGIKLWAASLYEKRVITEKPPPEAEAMLFPFRVNNV